MAFESENRLSNGRPVSFGDPADAFGSPADAFGGHALFGDEKSIGAETPFAAEAPFGALDTRRPQIWLAPMEGVVDPIVRDLWTRNEPPDRGGGAPSKSSIDYCVSEFIRVTDKLLPDHVFYKIVPELLAKSDTVGLTQNSSTGSAAASRSVESARSCTSSAACQTSSGVPVIPQLLGGQPEPMARNAFRLVEIGAPGIDLNFGCPAKTVNSHDGGAALLKNPSRVFDVTRAVRAAVPAHLTVSAKVRLGFSDKSLYLEIAQAAEEAGASWLTVHARTRDEGYRPPAHWEYTSRMREELKIPVIANGEVWTVADYWKCREVTGCQHVMIGRGLIAEPLLASVIKSSLAARASVATRGPFAAISATGRPTSVSAPSWGDYKTFIRTFGSENLRLRGENYAASRMKQLLKAMSRHYSEAAELFNQIKTFHHISEMLPNLENASAEQTLVKKQAIENRPPLTEDALFQNSAPQAEADSTGQGSTSTLVV